jgi:hypothetical protein
MKTLATMMVFLAATVLVANAQDVVGDWQDSLVKFVSEIGLQRIERRGSAAKLRQNIRLFALSWCGSQTVWGAQKKFFSAARACGN